MGTKEKQRPVETYFKLENIGKQGCFGNWQRRGGGGMEGSRHFSLKMWTTVRIMYQSSC